MDKYLDFIQEGIVFKSRIMFNEEVIQDFLRGFQKALNIVKKYKIWHLQQVKKNPDTWENPPSIQIYIKQQSLIGTIVSKKQPSGSEKYRFEIHDGDNADARKFTNSRQDHVVAVFDINAKWRN